MRFAVDRRGGPALFALAGAVAIGATFVSEPAAVMMSDAHAQETAPAVPATPWRWQPAMVAALVDEIRASAAEGLDPAAYGAEALADHLVRTGGSAELDRMAETAALALAHDYLLGRIANRAAFDWHIERTDADPSRLAGELARARAEGRVQPWLRSLLPTDARYAGLRDALAATPAADAGARDRLRANLERWRWMPRTLGADHIYVNVPSYTLTLVEDGQARSTYTVVVGARATPTPQISYPANAIVLNPWWTPPASIKVSAGKPGFVNDGGALRQRPGPGNALGRIKIDLPNPHAIYLHDTPAKAYFAKPTRAYSHGCIRVQDIDRLATELVALDQGNAEAVTSGLRTYATQRLKLRQSRPVWLVYFTAEVGADGKVRELDDPYGRDARLIAKLDQRVQFAAR
jgi:murein L,D-transpeptidase YcbB/YkuD